MNVPDQLEKNSKDENIFTVRKKNSNIFHSINFCTKFLDAVSRSLEVSNYNLSFWYF